MRLNRAKYTAKSVKRIAHHCQTAVRKGENLSDFSNFFEYFCAGSTDLEERWNVNEN